MGEERDHNGGWQEIIRQKSTSKRKEALYWKMKGLEIPSQKGCFECKWSGIVKQVVGNPGMSRHIGERVRN